MGYDQHITSVFGPLRAVFLPVLIAEEWEKICVAVFAWDFGLSRSNVEIVEHLVSGLPIRDITERMGFAEENSVKNRLHEIYDRLNVTSRNQVAAIAIRYGIGLSEDGKLKG